MKTYEQNPSKRWGFARERGKSGYLPSYYLMFLEHDGLPDETRFTPPIPSESDIIFLTRS